MPWSELFKNAQHRLAAAKLKLEKLLKLTSCVVLLAQKFLPERAGVKNIVDGGRTELSRIYKKIMFQLVRYQTT